MKIVYISGSIIPSRTANSIHVMKMCQAFAKNGHEVILLAPDRHREYERGVDDIYEYYNVENSFKILKINYIHIKYVRHLYYPYKVLQKLNEIKPDLVYGRELYGCFLSAYRFTTVFELHAPMGNQVAKYLLNKLNTLPGYQKTVVISEALKKIVSEEQKINLNDILVAHDGADEVEDLSATIKLRGKSNSLKVGYVGHLYKGKGLEVIEAIADKASKGIEFHIIGGFEEDIKNWKNKIVSQNVYFYGFVPQKDLGKYINSLDICLLPNQMHVSPYGDRKGKINISEYTSPIKMFDYMAHKKAIISSDLPVLREVLNNDNSILVTPNDYSGWLGVIETIRDNAYLRHKISENAYLTFGKQYSWFSRAKNIILSIGSLANSPKKSTIKESE